MKNKRLLFGLGVMVFVVGCFGSSFTSATSFHIEVEKLNAYGKAMANNIVPVHFADNGNDFGGFLYFSNSNLNLEVDDCPDGDKSGDLYDDNCEGDTLVTEDEDSSGEIYSITGKDEKGNDINYECKTWVKGFYYNAERGERLWPLDTETWSDVSDNLKVDTEGGIYTQCRLACYRKGDEKRCYEDEYNKCAGLNSECTDENPEECEDSSQGDESIDIDTKACTDAVDREFPYNNGYFGQVKHSYKGQDFGLVLGATYKKGDTWFEMVQNGNGVKLATTFIRSFNKFPLGFVYDYNGGLGFAGCEIKDLNAEGKKSTLRYLLSKQNNLETLFEPKNDVIKYNGIGNVDCENIGSAADSLIKLIIEGLIGMNRESDLGVIGNQSDIKMQYFSSSDINSATLLNYVKQRSEILCRGKWVVPNETMDITTKFTDSKTVCLDYSNSNKQNKTVDENISKWTKDHGKTLVVKNADVEVVPFSSGSDFSYYDMFINGGNLIIKEKDKGDPEFVFTTQGFIASGVSVDDYMAEIEPFMTDESTDSYSGDYAGVGSFIRGNFIVDGHVKGDTDNRKLNNKYFIYGKFTTKDEFKDLEDTFARRCSNGYVVNKKGKIQDNQGKYCPSSIMQMVNIGGGKEEKQYVWKNPYEGASLVVIDQNYDSPLYW